VTHINEIAAIVIKVVEQFKRSFLVHTTHMLSPVSPKIHGAQAKWGNANTGIGRQDAVTVQGPFGGRGRCESHNVQLIATMGSEAITFVCEGGSLFINELCTEFGRAKFNPDGRLAQRLRHY
jgi:hypothetical protein